MKRISSLHHKWLKDPAYRKEYDSFEQEFALASAMIAARTLQRLAYAAGTRLKITFAPAQSPARATR